MVLKIEKESLIFLKSCFFCVIFTQGLLLSYWYLALTCFLVRIVVGSNSLAELGEVGTGSQFIVEGVVARQGGL